MAVVEYFFDSADCRSVVWKWKGGVIALLLPIPPPLVIEIPAVVESLGNTGRRVVNSLLEEEEEDMFD